MRQRRFRIRNKKTAALRILLLFVGLVVVLGTILGLYMLLRSGSANIELNALPITPGDSFAYTGNGFLYYKEEKISYKDDTDAKKDFSIAVSGGASNVNVVSSGSISALYNPASVYLLDSGALAQISGNIDKVICGASHFAVLGEENGEAEALQVYDANANQVDRIDLASTYLLNFGFDTTEDETLWTLTLDTASATPTSTLTTYNMTQGVTNGLITVQNQLVERLCFTPDSFFAVCTDNIIRYNRVGNSEAYRVMVYGWEYCDYSGALSSSPMFLLKPRGAEGLASVRIYRLQEGNIASATITTVQLPQGTLCAFLSSGRLVAITDDMVYIYAASGALSSKTRLAKSIDSAVKLTEHKALVTSGGQYYMINIK